MRLATVAALVLPASSLIKDNDDPRLNPVEVGMRGLNLLPLLASTYTAALVCALPLTTDQTVRTDSPLANAPLPTSENLIDRRTTLASRTSGLYAVFVAGTETKVNIQAGWMAMNMSKIIALLRVITNLATQRIAEHGDRVVPISDLIILGSSMAGEGVLMTLNNANNHQLTYGVVHGAALALGAFINKYGGFQSVEFQIIDGKNVVGTGKIVA